MPTQAEMDERLAQIAALEARQASMASGNPLASIAKPVIKPSPEEQAYTDRLDRRKAAYSIPDISPQQKAIQDRIDRAAAVTGADQHYRRNNNTFSSDGALGSLLSTGINKFVLGRDKKLAASEETLFKSLQNTREAKLAEQRRTNQNQIRKDQFGADEKAGIAVDLAQSKQDLQTQKYNVDSYAEGNKSAIKHLANARNLQRFLKTNHQTPEGALAGALTGVRNVMATFGMESEGLVAAQTGQQALSAILTSEMTERGARGLTDKDMDILRESMPAMDTDSKARRIVAEVLLEAAQRQVYGQIDAYDQNVAAGSRLIKPAWMPQMRAEYDTYKQVEAEELELERLERELEEDDIAQGMGL